MQATLITANALSAGKNRPRSASAAEGMTDVIEVVGVSSERRTSGASAGDGGGSTDNLVDITGRALSEFCMRLC